MQPSSGGCFPSIQFFSTEAVAFVMPWHYCIEGKQPPEDGCMKPKHVVEENK
jgi:hypothetical protein